VVAVSGVGDSFLLAFSGLPAHSRGEMTWRLPRAALLALALTAALVLNTTATAQAPPGSLWYNGDFNGVNGVANERNTLVAQAAVYDDFDVTAPMGWHVTAIFSDNLMLTGVPIMSGADWEIRIAVSEGNAGTLVASGTTNAPMITPTGRVVGNELVEYMVEVPGLNVSLPMLPSGQHYWLNVTPVGNGFGSSNNSTTSGANCVGTPVATMIMLSSIAPLLAITSPTLAICVPAAMTSPWA
jgi:hypothetical protein